MFRLAGKILISLSLGVPTLVGAEDLNKILGAQSSQELTVIQKERRSMLVSLMGSGAKGAFGDAFVQGKWKKALELWGSQVEGKGAFALSDNGKGLLGFILFVNGFEVLGIETLFSVKDPTQVFSMLKAEWNKVAVSSNPAWKLVRVKWHPEWTKTFGVGIKIRAMAWRLRGDTDLQEIEAMITKTMPNTAERAWLQWQLVTSFALREKEGEAAKLLGPLIREKVHPISKDLLTLTAARLLYKRGFLDMAAKYYGQIPKSSFYWFVAQEELAWIYLRKGRNQDVIAQTNTFAYTNFGNLVGPEVYYLRALGQLQICDYPNGAKTLIEFKRRFRARTKQMLKVEKKGVGNNNNIDSLVQKLSIPGLSVKAAGTLVAELFPRKILRDEEIRQLVQSILAFDRELVKANSFKGISSYQWLTEELKFKISKLKMELNNRVKTLASRELKEIDDVLTKMYVVEVEMIQQVDSAAKRLAKMGSKIPKGQLRKGQTGSIAKDALVFQHKASEVWFDELANYKVNVTQFCQNKGGK